MIQSLNEMKTIEGRDLDPVIQRDTLLGGETATSKFGVLSMGAVKDFTNQGVTDSCVKTEAQTLSDAEKNQAIANLGIINDSSNANNRVLSAFEVNQKLSTKINSSDFVVGSYIFNAPPGNPQREASIPHNLEGNVVGIAQNGEYDASPEKFIISTKFTQDKKMHCIFNEPVEQARINYILFRIP